MNNKTYYLKSLPITYTREANISNGDSGLISYEKFNREFAKNNIGVNVPNTFFFEDVSRSKNDSLYIGTVKIDNLKFFDHRNPVNDNKAGHRGTAKLAVAQTFIHDLHEANYGYNQDGLILIDVDGIDQPPKSITEYLQLAASNMLFVTPTLSIHHVKQMRDIYKNMQKKALPKYHGDFHLTSDVYHQLLNHYINLCDKTIKFVVKGYYPTFNELWSDSAMELISVLAPQPKQRVSL